MPRDAEIIRARVRTALAVNVSEDYILQFLTDVRNNMREAERRTRRATGFICYWRLSSSLFAGTV